jgi:hypothetical protein
VRTHNDGYFQTAYRFNCTMKTKIKFIFTVSLFGLSIFGCKNVDDLLTFTISDATNFRIESTSPLTLPFDIATPDVTTNSNQKFQNNNTSASLVKDIKLQELKLTVTSPNDRNFDFLKSVEVFISTDQHSEILLAHLHEVPLNTKVISLTPTTQKLDDYVKASSYKLRTKIITDETLSQSVDVRMDLSFKVTAAPL